MMDHPHDDIDALALGELDPARAREVLTHADACPTCAVLVADAMNGIAALAQVESPMDVKHTARAPRLVALAGSPVNAGFARRKSAFQNAVGWFAAAAAAVSLGLFAWNIQLRNDALGVPVTTLVHSHFIHHPLTNPKTSAAAKVLQAPDGRWLSLIHI